jgi:SAM-dependent methyltransferase
VAEASPLAQITALMSGYWHTQAIYAAAKLGVADLLRDGPRSAADLAAAAGTDPRALYRLLRALAGLGIFAEEEGQRFALTPMAEFLRTDAAGSVRSLAVVRGEWQYEAWGRLLYSVQTGRSAFEHVQGMPLFEYLSRHPEKGRLFDEAMTGIHGQETAAMLEAYDFSAVGTLADVGGGNGSVLTAILGRYPSLVGILFDLPGVAGRARANIEAGGLARRCRVVGGSFFEAVPAGADVYLLRHIIHDWDDARSVAILRNCRQAMGPGGKLLVVEGVVPPGNEPSVSKFYDLAMMVLPGGMERTEGEYRLLFEAAGFRLSRIVPTRSWVSLIEGEAAP